MSDTTIGSGSGRAAQERGARRRHMAVTVAASVVTSVIYLVVVLVTAGRLPDTMATHFGLGGQPDAFTATPLALLLQGAVVVGVPLALLAVFAAGGWWRGEYARSFSALIVGMGAGLLGMFVALTLAHVGVVDPVEVTLTPLVGLLALGAGAAAGATAFLVLPKPLPRLPDEPVVPFAIAPGERLSWFGQAHTTSTVTAVLTGGVVVMVLAAVVTGIWWLLLVAALMVLLMLAILTFEVTIDARGLTWRGAMGFPRGSIGLEDVRQASVMEVSPGDFGGMGLRAMPGRLGIITRSGRALRVRHERGELVITVDDAGTAAGVLEGLRLAQR